jgi:hypothetical protein
MIQDWEPRGVPRTINILKTTAQKLKHSEIKTDFQHPPPHPPPPPFRSNMSFSLRDSKRTTGQVDFVLWRGDAKRILSYPILSYPILSYPILSYPILSYPILSYPILFYSILYFSIIFYSTGRLMGFRNLFKYIKKMHFEQFCAKITLLQPCTANAPNAWL